MDEINDINNPLVLLSRYGNRFVIWHSVINIDANVATRSDSSEILNFFIDICSLLTASIKTRIYIQNVISYEICIAFEKKKKR